MDFLNPLIFLAFVNYHYIDIIFKQKFGFGIYWSHDLVQNDFFLLTADRESLSNEKQTPVHYAAKNDACNSLKMLIKMKCKYDNVLDYKGRTPLFVAAELGIHDFLYHRVIGE